MFCLPSLESLPHENVLSLGQYRPDAVLLVPEGELSGGRADSSLDPVLIILVVVPVALLEILAVSP